MKRVAKKYKGMFWHVHHDRLAEWSDDIRERIAYVREEKPNNEVETRLRLMKKVKSKVPSELKEADAKRKEAYVKWEEADAKRKEAYVKWKEAYVKWKEADAKRKEAYVAFLPLLEKLHKKECNCTEWNGKALVFVK